MLLAPYDPPCNSERSILERLFRGPGERVCKAVGTVCCTGGQTGLCVTGFCVEGGASDSGLPAICSEYRGKQGKHCGIVSGFLSHVDGHGKNGISAHVGTPVIFATPGVRGIRFTLPVEVLDPNDELWQRLFSCS